MKEEIQKGDNRFRKIGITTIIAVYLLILVGGIVRSTGSGMGCPDWPKCFGNWVPPSNVNELPANYQEIYANKRTLKNLKFSGYLEFFGFSELAQKIRSDQSIMVEQEFNTAKTWTEYFNRLLGAIVGVLIIASCIYALSFRKKDKVIPTIACLCVLLVIFQGWIGSVVVSTNLLPWMITFHMLLALLLVALLIYMVFRAFPNPLNSGLQKSKLLRSLLITCIILLLIQVSIGTQVREAIDEIAMSFGYQNRYSWISELDWPFYFHRTFSLLILAFHVGLIYVIWKFNSEIVLLKQLTGILVFLIGIEIITGVVMAYFAIPSFAQPVHLLLSSLIFGLQFLLLLIVSRKEGQNNHFLSKRDVNFETV